MNSFRRRHILKKLRYDKNGSFGNVVYLGDGVSLELWGCLKFEKYLEASICSYSMRPVVVMGSWLSWFST